MNPFTVRQGYVWWGKLLLSPQDAERLQSLYRAAADNPADYFHDTAAERSAQLAAAMEQVQ